MPERVLITDGRSLAALAIARSLGSKGIEVHLGEEFGHNITSFSKYVETNHVYPSPEEHPDEFVEWLAEVFEQERYDSLIPVRDAATLLVAKNKERFAQKTGLCVADYDVIKSLRDKGQTMKLAAEHGIPIPRTYFPDEDGFGQIYDEATLPLLIKPRDESGARGIVRVKRFEELEARYRAVDREYTAPIVQEYVDHSGGHYSIGTLFDGHSEPVAIHVYKETKQYPMSGGPAVNAVSVEKKPWVDEILQMLRAVGWQGPAHMDVLYDPADDIHKVLEVNPRFWMSLQASICSGVDFPRLLYELATGRNAEFQNGFYKTGVTYRWIMPNGLLWLANTTDKISGVQDLLRSRNGSTCYGVLSTRDPMPLLGVASQSLRFLTDSEKRKAIFDRGWEV